MISGAGNTSKLKQQNLELIRNLLKKKSSATRAEISRCTGLSIATCGNLIKELINSGEVFHIGMKNDNGGRPAKRYVYNEKYAMVAGISVEVKDGHCIVESVVADLHGNLLKKESKESVYFDCKAALETIEHILVTFPIIKSVVIGLPPINKKTCIFIDYDGIHKSDFIGNAIKLGDYKLDIKKHSTITAYGFCKSDFDLQNKTVVILTVYDSCFVDAGIAIKGQVYTGDTDSAGTLEEINSTCRHMETALCIIIYLQRILDPSLIVINGCDSESALQDIIKEIKCHMSGWCDPKIVCLENTDEEYINGLIHLALDNMEK